MRDLSIGLSFFNTERSGNLHFSVVNFFPSMFTQSAVRLCFFFVMASTYLLTVHECFLGEESLGHFDCKKQIGARDSCLKINVLSLQ